MRANTAQLVLFTETVANGRRSWSVAFRVFRARRGRTPRLRLPLPSRAEMRALHELCSAAWNRRCESRPSHGGEDLAAMSILEAMA